jgi:hypothetical protein
VRNVAKALKHSALGFEVKAYGEGDPSDPIYISSIATTSICTSRASSSLDPNNNCSACYLKVGDAAEVHAEWTRAGVRRLEPKEMLHGLRESSTWIRTAIPCVWVPRLIGGRRPDRLNGLLVSHPVPV